MYVGHERLIKKKLFFSLRLEGDPIVKVILIHGLNQPLKLRELKTI